MRVAVGKFAILVALVAGLSFPCAAGAADEAKVAVVNFQRVLQESKKGKEANAEFEAEVQKRQKAMEKLGSELQAMKEELESQAVMLTEKMKIQKAEELRQKQKDFQRRASDYDEEMKLLNVKLTTKLKDEIQGLVKDYAKNNGIELVLETSSVGAIYIADSLDVTEKIISLYDKQKAK